MGEQVDFIVADLNRFVRGEVIALALNVNANLRDQPPLGTPIDTGWASANWVPSVGQPYEDSGIDGVKPTPALVASRERIAQQGLNELLSWRNEDGPLFSSNNVPYIKPLNNGHSQQSPAGFVPAAVERAIQQTYTRAGAKASRDARASDFRNRKPR